MFILGSCRIWSSAYLRKWSDATSTIQCHFADEIIQNLKWLISKNKLSDEEKHCFRDNINDNDWLLLVENFKNSDTVLIEISSIKVKHYNNLYINVLNNLNANTITSELLDISSKIIEIFDIINKLDKKVIFFCHVNVYSKRNLGFISNRTMLQDSFRKALKSRKFDFIDPSEFVNYHGQIKCMASSKNKDNVCDINHYSHFMIELISRQISMILKI